LQQIHKAMGELRMQLIYKLGLAILSGAAIAAAAAEGLPILLK
jgi:hypothetical protein